MKELAELIHKIAHLSLEERISLFMISPSWQHFCSTHVSHANLLPSLSKEHQYVFLSLILLKQGDNLFTSPYFESDRFKIVTLFEKLWEIETFYRSLGGILGYHLQFMKLLKEEISLKDSSSFLHPQSIDITQGLAEQKIFLEKEIHHLDKIAYILPMGGAGDRLGLVDEKTKKPLPVALFNFSGFSLIEWMFMEVTALEHLYFEKTGSSISIPMVFMTSDEKENHQNILNFLEEKKFFHKNREDILFCKQPLVPMISEQGKWVFHQPYELCLKPGGHGALWKVLENQKGFEFLQVLKKKRYGIVRQINNPIGGMDQNILALLSYGISHKKAFGFTTCDRLVGSASGMILLEEKKTASGILAGHANVEYSNFSRWDLLDIPKTPESPYSEYPANANILFVDLEKAYEAIQKDPFHGMILNMKNEWEYLDSKGKKVIEKIGRPEIVMQNLSYAFFLPKAKSQKQLLTFLISNIQRKTLSPIKTPPKLGKFLESAERCLYDLLYNYAELLKKSKIQLPSLPSKELFHKKGFPFFVFLSPLLGPLFDMMSEKIDTGVIYQQSELRLEISHLELSNFELDGSLIIQAKDDQKIPRGECVLRNVIFKNKGLGQNSLENFWKNQINRQESLSIELQGHSQFLAENVIFENQHHFVVPDRHLLKIKGKANHWEAKLFPLEENSYVAL